MPSPSSCAARRTTRRADGPTRSIAAATLLIALFASGAWAAAGPTDRIAAGVQLRQAATGAAPALRFGRLSVDDGLSQSTVSAMLQDRLGYLWIGTLDGLNRYDGYGVTTYRYDPFTPSGLAGNLITALAEDARGRIWVGTAFGLSRLDDPVAGSFTHFRSDPDAPASLPSNLVQRLLPSADGGLWVVTGRGRLSFIAPDTDRVTRLTHDPDDPATLPDDRVHRTYLGSHTPGIPLVEDARGRLWIGTRAGLTRRAPDGSLRRWPLAPSVDDLAAITGESAADDGAIPVTDLRIDASGNTLWIATWGRGIHRLDLTADAEDALGPQTALRHTPGTPYSLGDDRVHSLWIDDVGALWIGRVGGVDRADPAFGLVQRYAIDDRGTDAPRGWIDAIFGLTTAPLDYLPVVPRYRDPHGDVWMVHGDGMLQLDIAHQQLVAVDHHPSDPRSLGAGPIRCTLIDRQGALWIGTDTGGVSHLDLRARPFGHVRHLPGQDDGLSSSDVFPIAYASDGGVWVGSLEGLDRVDPQTGAIRRLRHDPTDPASSLSSDRVLSLLADGDTLWIGTVDGGLDRLDLGTGAIRRYPAQTDPPADDPGILRGATPYALARGRDGTLWIGMTGGGLHRLDAPDAATPRYVRYANDPDDPTSLISSTVWVVHEDAQARLWVGTPGGLHRFDRARDRFVRYPLRSAESKSTVNNGVWTIYEDDDGVLWLGTLSGGLQRFEPDTGRFMPHTTATSALPNNTVMTIVPDRDGYLWLGTNNGLARFDPRTEQFRVFDQDHGLQSLEFNHQSATRTPDGRLWFGGINGISVIDPRDVLKPSAAPTVRIRRLTQIANGTSYGRADLDRPIALAPDARDLRFDYVGLHYATPSRMRYAHRLDPHDSDWQPVGGARSAAYTNLPPGRYVFRVRAAHRDGPWSPDATVHFEIRPPWWRAPWALAGYGLLMVLGVFLVDRVQRRRLIRRERRRAADDRMRAEQARRLADLEEARDLQLSMLPDTVPHHPRVTLAAYMKTADVVGGDYYDFAVGDDGTITLALGDATGHGARAGLMVTATKSLFNLLARDDDLERLLRRTDESLRAMRLRRLHMALMAARLTPDAALLLLGTSLPPALHHRAASRTIDELPLDGLPLGSRHAGNRYANHHLQLAPGDVVVLLTDGLPERPAPDAQPFGYARVRDALARALIDGVTSPNALIQRLLTAADEWADGQPQTDDITLIVLRAGDD